MIGARLLGPMRGLLVVFVQRSAELVFFLLGDVFVCCVYSVVAWALLGSTPQTVCLLLQCCCISQHVACACLCTTAQVCAAHLLLL